MKKTGDNGETQVVFAYTAIADKTLINLVETALTEISGQELAGLTISSIEEHSAEAYPAWLPFMFLAVALFLLTAIIHVALMLYRPKKNRSSG